MKKDFSVIGVGSPIVDLIAQVSDDFLKNVPGEKGGMVMIGNDDLNHLTALLGEENVKRTPGGSAGNTLFDLAHFGVKTALLGTAGQDEAGCFYKSKLIEAGGSAHALRYSEKSPTAHCICLVTPDAERTMRPALAAALEFDPASVKAADFSGYT
ncbi:MAG: adenosine kinase, partial [Lentisphaeria bacterium]|nr:adenosine kinase [Lentisphaeria bacterium]